MSQYATTTDLARLGIASAATSSVDATTRDAQLAAASALADSYLASRYTLPLTAWGDDLRRAVCSIAAWDSLSVRGYDPQRGGDEAVRLRAEDAMRWLDRVASGRVTPVGVTDSTPSTDEATEQTLMVTNASRGWQRR